MTCNVFGGTLSLTQSIDQLPFPFLHWLRLCLAKSPKGQDTKGQDNGPEVLSRWNSLMMMMMMTSLFVRIQINIARRFRFIHSLFSAENTESRRPMTVGGLMLASLPMNVSILHRPAFLRNDLTWLATLTYRKQALKWMACLDRRASRCSLNCLQCIRCDIVCHEACRSNTWHVARLLCFYKAQTARIYLDIFPTGNHCN